MGVIPATLPRTVEQAQSHEWAWARALATDGLAVAALFAAVAFFYRGLLNGDILVSYDLFTYFYPLRDFTDSALREGRLPLWNPYLFLGSPFLANIQTAVFYPLWWPFLLLDAPHAVLSSILLHVYLAGLAMYCFARSAAGLSPWGALGAALPYMFGGYLSQKVGNPNQLQVIAWLPFLLLTVDRALSHASLRARRGALVWTLLAGVVLALQVLAGHPQMVYLSLCAAGLLALYRVVFPARYQEQSHRFDGHAGRAATATVVLVSMGLVAIGLAAVQILPTLELLPYSIRGGGLTYAEGASFSLPFWELLRATLPSFSEPPSSEFFAYIGFLPIGLALAAVRRGGHPLVGLCFIMGAVALFFGLGGYNPLYELLYDRLPGLNQFRVPARWLLLFTFAGSLAAGIGLEAIYRAWPSRQRPRPLVLETVAFWGALVGLVWLLDAHLVTPTAPGWSALWLTATFAALLVARVGPEFVWYGGPVWRRWSGTALVCLALLAIAGELYIEGLNLQRNRPVGQEAYASLEPTLLQLLARGDDAASFRIISLASSEYTPGNRQDIRISLPELSDQALTEYVSGAKYKEILAPNLSSVYRIATVDGYDGGVLPLQRYVDLRTMLVESGGTLSANPRQRDAVLRFLLAGIPDPVLLGALNVRYVVTDKLDDVWADNIYYDTAFTARVPNGQRVEFAPQRPFLATTLGLMSFVLEGHEGEQGEPVAQVIVEGDGGERQEFVLQLGVDTAQGDVAGPELRHQQARIASPWRTNPNAYNYLTTLQFQEPLSVRRVEVVSLLDKGIWHLRSLSLADQRTGASTSVAVDNRFALVSSGDLKLYRLEREEPRLTIEHDFRVEPNDGRALEMLSLDRAVVHVAQEPVWRSKVQPLERAEGIEVLAADPERLLLRVHVVEPGLLYQRETYFPGWNVWVDGEEEEILLANGLFRAVAVAAGSHTVELRYEPAMVKIGVPVSLGSLAIVGVILLIAVRRKPKMAPK